MKRILALSLAALLTGWMVASAQTAAPPGPFEGFKSADDEPIDIHADRMELDMTTGQLDFKGHVSARQGKRTIYSDRMQVRYTGEGKITWLDARGNVKVVMGDAFATCGRLTLENVKKVIELMDNPRVVQGRQIVMGDKMTYYMSQERLTVSNPRIEWTPEPTGKTP